MVHIFRESHIVLWNLQYWDFDHLSDTPTCSVIFGKGCPTAKLSNFLKKGENMIWPVEGRFVIEMTQLFWQSSLYYAKP